MEKPDAYLVRPTNIFVFLGGMKLPGCVCGDNGERGIFRQSRLFSLPRSCCKIKGRENSCLKKFAFHREGSWPVSEQLLGLDILRKDCHKKT